MPAPTFRYERLQDHEETFEGALAVVAFPAPGFVAQVAARYLVSSQDLALVGAFRSDVLPPSVAIEQGEPRPPVRVHLGKRSCGLDQRCDSLAVVSGDLVVPPELQAPLARAILDWAKAEGVQSVVVLEGMSLGPEGGSDSRLSAASPFESCREALREQGVEMLDGVLVSGTTGALLAAATPEDVPTLALFVEAHKAFQDAGAAATLLEAVDKLLLNIPIDVQPLRTRAEELTKQLRTSAMRQGIPAQASTPMYG